MATYYLIVGDELRDVLTRTAGDVTALPLLAEAQTVSLLNKKHADALLTYIQTHGKPSATLLDVMTALGLTDARQQGMGSAK